MLEIGDIAMKKKRKKMLMGGVALVAAIIGAGFMVEFMPDSWRWINVPFHSTIVAVGAMAAVIMGMVLVRRRSEIGEGHLFLPGLGFIAMGVLDGFHAANSHGQTFVFLHSVACLSGSIGFVLFRYSHRVSRSRCSKYLPWIVPLLAVMIGIGTVSNPEMQLEMLSNGMFTKTAIVINHTAGLIFLISALFFGRGFYLSGDKDVLRFYIIAILFGLAGIIFSFSRLWDSQWWMWHLTRFGTLMLTLSVLVRAYQRSRKILIESQAELAAKTIELDEVNAALTEETKKLEDAYLSLSEQTIMLELTNTALDEESHKLERSNANLITRNRELDEFSYVASHDLQEPLRKLTSFCALLEIDLGGDLNEQAQKDMDFIKDAAKRMQNLVQDLLELSRAGRSAMKREKIGLSHCAERALDALATRVEETNAIITQDSLPEIWGDVTMLTQIYQNLIGNALKFIPEGTLPRIHLSCEEIEDEIVFGVRDNGIGMKPEYTEQIFMPFKRLHGREKYEGTGIGLAICRKAVERHSGRIWVESELGTGSHFRFTIAQRKRKR